MKRSTINDIFNPDTEFMKWVFNRIYGFTIALEPEHTGGIIKSLELLKIVN